AEDGIRDRNVTGVQTCALPIYRAGRQVVGEGTRVVREPRERPGEPFRFEAPEQRILRSAGESGQGEEPGAGRPGSGSPAASTRRSEERRGGKGGRWGGRRGVGR